MFIRRIGLLCFIVAINSLNLYAYNSAAIRNLRDENCLTDKILKSTDGEEFPCHAMILACASKYFKNMFTAGFKEGDQKIIKFPYSSQTIKIILDVIYKKPAHEMLKNDLALNTYLELKDFADLAFLHVLNEYLRKAKLHFNDNAWDQEIAAALKLKDKNVINRIFANSKIRPIIIFRQEHPNCLNSISLSKDGAKIVIGNNNNFVKVFKTNNGTELLTLAGHTGWVPYTAFSNDGTKIATASHDNTVKIWDANFGNELFSFSGIRAEYTGAIAFSDDSTKLIFYDNNVLKIFDLTSKSFVSTICGLCNYPNSAAFSPNGTQVIISHNESGADIFDPVSGDLLFVLRAYSSPIISASYNHQGTKIILAGDETVSVFDAKSQNLVTNLDSDSRNHFGVFNSDDTKILVGGNDDTATIFEAATGKELLKLQHIESVYKGSFIDEIKVITVSSNHHQIWVLPPRELYDVEFLMTSTYQNQWFNVKFQLERYLKNLKKNEEACYKDFIEKARERSEDFKDLLEELISKYETLKTYLSGVFYDFELS